ncbi:MAG: hypothetical protein J2P20_01915 [Pseudonocardia sp.]|nr:hypothetical protein [Pseudonocardia sp.]MBO0875070.1 hypothetical protein [Pseudonocardia sp.]
MARVPMSPEILDTLPAPGPVPDLDSRTDFLAIQDNLFDGERIDGIYRGGRGGAELLAITNRRLMIVESEIWEGRTALTSMSFSQVASVSYLASEDTTISSSTIVGIRSRSGSYEVHCQTEGQAREVHDLITWNLVGV